MEGIQVTVSQCDSAGEVALLRVGGYVDTTTTPELERALDGLLRRQVPRIIVDLSTVDYISSAGWGIFISELKGIRERGGDLKLARMVPEVHEVFSLLEFHHILCAYDTVEQALEAFAHEEDSGGTPPATAVAAGGAGNPAPAEARPAAAPDPLPEAPPSEGSLPLEDKIRRVVRENPEYGAREIQRALRSPRFGDTSAGWVRVRLALRTLGLGTLKKRVVFARRAG